MYCEKRCVAGCCGIDAFDFSPLHVASYLSSFNGRITEHDIEEWESLLRKAERLTKELMPDGDGFLCSVEGMNQCFRRGDFESFIAELRHSIRVAPKMLETSNQIKLKRASEAAV